MTATGPELPVYPLSLRLAGRLAVVVGGGSVAVRRVAGLRAGGASILVVAPGISPSLADLAARGIITVRRGTYQAADLAGAWLVLACTSQPDVNAAVAADAERSRIWCVRADDAEASAAWVPAVGRAGAATIAVNAGRNPRRAAALRDLCVQAVADASGRAASAGGQPKQPEAAGRVSIVGAGPGDPGLITVAGLQRLRSADVVVTDRLVPAELLADLPADVQVIDSAKVPAGPSAQQEEISAALVNHARAGRAVVRLKGGDPFVFGRGREEVDACLAAGVAVEVLPGVTSAIAVPAAAGVPVTHRGLTQGFTVVSGHVSPGDPASAVNWAALARSGTTLVLLMAAGHLPAITGELTAAGLAADTPACCVAEGWTARQRVVTATLSTLAEAARAAGVASPAVVVIGDTARYAAAGGLVPSGGPQAAAPAAARLPGTGGRAALPPRRVLMLGGARSGKSAAAEQMLAGCEQVEYVATGYPPDGSDGEWAARVGEHRRRRPPHWRTSETLDLERVLGAADPVPVLVDCLSVWLTRVLDECGGWDGAAGAGGYLAARVGGLVAAWRATARYVVAVSSEVGSGVMPASAAGRRFRDELGSLNARIAAQSDEVWLCTAGVSRRLR